MQDQSTAVRPSCHQSIVFQLACRWQTQFLYDCLAGSKLSFDVTVLQFIISSSIPALLRSRANLEWCDKTLQVLATGVPADGNEHRHAPALCVRAPTMGRDPHLSPLVLCMVRRHKFNKVDLICAHPPFAAEHRDPHLSPLNKPFKLSSCSGFISREKA